MKAVANTLGVARSNLIARREAAASSRSFYRKAEDATLLQAIRAVIDARPSYAYRRVTALVNRLRRTSARPATLNIV